MRRIVVVGAGIVGAAVARYISEDERTLVTVLERGPADRLLGSTGHAPGYLGLLVLSEELVGTQLARASADVYEELHVGGVAGFDRVGGVKIATTTAGMADLVVRAEAATAAGLRADILDPGDAVARAPHLIGAETCLGGVWYPGDGTARAGVITAALKRSAISSGARFVYDAAVTGFEVDEDGVRGVRVGAETFPADDVVISSGIWGPSVASLAGKRLDLTVVAHPYVYGPTGPSVPPAPFVRWPERHVYARHHGARVGLGTYDHTPVDVTSELGGTAERPWPGEAFDVAVGAALELLPPQTRFTPRDRLNGLFSMTADNLPLVGRLGMAGLWAAEALWVTHAAGAAQALARMMQGRQPHVRGLDLLDPLRFRDVPAAALTERALRLYRDIYAPA